MEERFANLAGNFHTHALDKRRKEKVEIWYTDITHHGIRSCSYNLQSFVPIQLEEPLQSDGPPHKQISTHFLLRARD